MIGIEMTAELDQTAVLAGHHVAQFVQAQLRNVGVNLRIEVLERTRMAASIPTAAALQLKPDLFDAHMNLAQAFRTRGKPGDVMTATGVSGASPPASRRSAMTPRSATPINTRIVPPTPNRTPVANPPVASGSS